MNNVIQHLDKTDSDSNLAIWPSHRLARESADYNDQI